MKRAFTLIELLVVIAIIAILAAILFPVFAQAKEAAKKSQCLSNTNQIAKAFQLYATDYDDTINAYLGCYKRYTYCPGYATINSATAVYNARLMPYVKAGADPASGGAAYPPAGPWQCPSWTLSALLKSADTTDCDGLPPASGLDAYFPVYVNPANGHQQLFSHYGVAFCMCSPAEAAANTDYCSGAGGGCPDANGGYGRDGKTVDNASFAYPGSRLLPGSHGHTRSQTEVARPAETMIAGDGAQWTSGGASDPLAGTRIVTVFGCESTYMHGNGGNFSFLDGHSKNVRGNPERYRYLGADGLWIEKYFNFYE